MSTQLSHATSPPPLPETFLWAPSPSASPRQDTALVDLTVPYESGLLPNTKHLRLQGSPRDSKRRSVIEQTSRQALRETRAGQEQGLIHEQTVRRHEGTESCTWVPRPVCKYEEGGQPICSRDHFVRRLRLTSRSQMQGRASSR
jgi:hypothetical protein